MEIPIRSPVRGVRLLGVQQAMSKIYRVHRNGDRSKTRMPPTVNSSARFTTAEKITTAVAGLQVPPQSTHAGDEDEYAPEKHL